LSLLLVALALLLGTGGLALVAGRWPRFATRTAAGGVFAASLLSVAPTLHALRGHALPDVQLPWAVPAGEICLGVDPLSAFFLVPLVSLGALCALYGCVYMRAYEPDRGLGAPAFLFNLMVAAMILVLIARHVLIFLVAWEIMTVASYLLVTFAHETPEVRRAGWVYLIAGHVGVAFLLALFLTLGQKAGGLGFAALARHPPAGWFAPVVFGLATLGFGVKAGIVPLHVWLPEAHAAAPSHVSAFMSGVLIKLGLYGLLRTLTWLQPAPWLGPALLVLGLAGGLLGISLALYQRDLKRTLAYSSIENIGVILVGFGVGFWGLARGHLPVAALGLYGALLHVWNHAIIKGLMFLAAGGVLHAAGTKDVERLGGLLQRMPWTGSLMILGSVAIAGLPPLNGFASEWLIYLGLLVGGSETRSAAGPLLLLVAAALAAIGVLAALCFVRLIGIALLGQPRSAGAEHAHESSIGLVSPTLVLALAIVTIPLTTPSITPFLRATAAQIAGASLGSEQVGARVGVIASVSAILWVMLLLVAVPLVLLARRRSAVDETWGCGYAAPTARMQYTGRSFAEMMAERFLPPRFRAFVVVHRPVSIFPSVGTVSSDCTDPLTRSAYEPFIAWCASRFSRLRWLQQGMLHVYLVYILLTVVVALAWSSARRWLGGT
jgi:formate hydrogenlyase subunit 3/multisubunit Na+/H+ antiporter MnhD subunit